MAGGYIVFRCERRVWLLPFSQVVLRKAFASPGSFAVRIIGELNSEGVEKVTPYSVDDGDVKVFESETEAFQTFLDWSPPAGFK